MLKDQEAEFMRKPMKVRLPKRDIPVRENEVTANRAVAMVSLAYVVMALLNEASFYIEYTEGIALANRYFYFPFSCVILITDLVAALLHFKKPWIKYVLIGEHIIAAGVSFFIYTRDSVFVLYLPFFLSIRYFNKRLRWGTIILMLSIFLISCALNVQLEQVSPMIQMWHQNACYNPWKNPIDVFIFVVVPIMTTGIVLAVYMAMTEKNGRRLIREQEAALTRISKIDAEMETASSLQQSVLPEQELTSPDGNFRVIGGEKSAKAVGGDFYDYFMLDEHTLVFLIADVSDKGLTAAMFMMSARKAVRCAVECTHSLDRAIELANRLICEDNKSEMFLTMWLGMIDTRSGIGKYINAGHCCPLLKSRDNSVREITNEPDLFLGNFPDYNPAVYPLKLAEGDQLLLYTDGLTDAVNLQSEFYGLERLKKSYAKSEGNWEEISSSMGEDWRAFTGSAEQFDDATALLLTCVKLEKPIQFEQAQETDIFEKKRITGLLTNALQAVCCPEKIRQDACVIVDELLTNICEYAYPGGKGPVKVRCTVTANSADLVFEDTGVPFDLTKTADPDLEGEPKIGGLGIWLVKNLADSISYRSEEGKNLLEVSLIWNV